MITKSLERPVAISTGLSFGAVLLQSQDGAGGAPMWAEAFESSVMQLYGAAAHTPVECSVRGVGKPRAAPVTNWTGLVNLQILFHRFVVDNCLPTSQGSFERVKLLVSLF